MDDVPYRERLNKLIIYSQESRRDRYMINFIWKIVVGLIEGFKLEFKGEGTKRGRECEVSKVVRTAPASITLRPNPTKIL